MSYLNWLENLAKTDVAALLEKDQAYGGSWKKRGGVGAFMMAARKWDRLEEQTHRYDWDIFNAAKDDARQEGILDDIRDLRRYLMLIEAEILERAGSDEFSLSAARMQQYVEVVSEERLRHGDNSPSSSGNEILAREHSKYNALPEAFAEECARRNIDPASPDMDLPNDLLDLKYPGRVRRVPKE